MNSDTFIPQSFLDDVKSYIPSHLMMEDFIQYCKKPLRRSVRVNTLKMSIGEFKQYCHTHNWSIEPIPWCDTGFWLDRTHEEEQRLQLGNTDIHVSGCIYVQEASSMLPPMALKTALKSDSIVLDMASAPGSKTTQIAALMDNEGTLVANELSSSRLKVLAANIKRMGVYNTALSHFDGKIFGEYMHGSFDAILLDAPCSGEGTVRKDPDALKNWSIQSNQDIAQVQKSLIESAFYALKPEGTLVYSTCTLTPLENQLVCEHLLEKFKGYIEIASLRDLFPEANKALTDEGYLHVWPQTYNSEGFFIAKFKKTGSLPHENQKTKKGGFPFQLATKKQQTMFHTHLNQHFGIATIPGSLMVRDRELWVFPSDFSAIANKIKYARIGVKVATTHKNGLRMEHEFATSFGHQATKNIFPLNTIQATAYYKGQDIPLDNETSNTGEVILTLCGTAVGLGKWLKKKVKNNLPRDLISSSNRIS